jgi:hypothetical protein
MEQRFLWMVGIVAVIAACGDDGASTNPTGGAASGGAGGSAATASGGAGGSAATASGGTGGDASGGMAGANSGGCSGVFGPHELVREDPGLSIGTPTLTADELELFYVQESSDIQSAVVVLRRASPAAPFSVPQAVPELSVCQMGEAQSLDVSADGLRIYFSCHQEGYKSAALRLASRAQRSSPFVPDPDPIGMVGLSIDVSRDELIAFSSANGAEQVPKVYTRPSLDDSFGGDEPVPGIEVDLLNPELSPDGLALLGAVRTDLQHSLTVARRSSPSEAFSAQSADGLPAPPAGESYASPVLSADCRSLYFVRVDELGTFSLQVAHR